MRPVLVHHVKHCEIALEAAHGHSVVLMTPLHGCAYLGVSYLWAMLEEAGKKHPDICFTSILHAGDAPGHVLAALRRGFKNIAFDGPPDITAVLSDLALQQNGRLIAPPQKTLDLSLCRDPAAACLDWLTPALSR